MSRAKYMRSNEINKRGNNIKQKYTKKNFIKNKTAKLTESENERVREIYFYILRTIFILSAISIFIEKIDLSNFFKLFFILTFFILHFIFR